MLPPPFPGNSPPPSAPPAAEPGATPGAPTPTATGDVAAPTDLAGDGTTNEPSDDPAPPAVPDPTPVEPEPTDCVIPPLAAAPIGYGAATTGGGNAPPVIVSSFAEAEAALEAYRDAFEDGSANALVIRYTGSFDFSTITDVCAQHTKDAQILQIKEMENVTFEGAPGSSANFGIKVNRARNVIIRNMTMGLLPGGGDSDAITLEGNETNGDVENVWVDHNELFSSTKEDCDGAGDTEFDGLIDIKKGARRITISYNYLHDHQKTGLIGHSDSDDTERYVTFHHNRYENVVSRTPLHRFGYVHLFNNYYGQITSSGINVRMGGVALIEQNFFENAQNPITSRYSDEAGFWDLRDNHVGPGVAWDVEEDTLANADTWQSTTTFPASELDYAYTPDRAGCVKQIVLATAGAKL
jgi:pectate lyase